MSRLQTYSSRILNRDPDDYSKSDFRVAIRNEIQDTYGINGLEFSQMPLVDVMYDAPYFDNLMETLCHALTQF